MRDTVFQLALALRDEVEVRFLNNYSFFIFF
jgi:hypothetical protein